MVTTEETKEYGDKEMDAPGEKSKYVARSNGKGHGCDHTRVQIEDATSCQGMYTSPGNASLDV